jgi:hypothetical protein
MKKLILVAAATAVLLAVPAATNASTSVRPTISGFAVAPSSLPAAGGTVYVTAHVKHASKCMLVFPDGGSRWVGCASGHLSTAEKFSANSTSSTYTTNAHIVAYNKYGRAWSRVVAITVAASPTPPPPPSPTATLSITPSSVPATGGSAVLSFSSSHASSCTVSSTPAFWTGANPTTVNCNGSYTATLASTTTEQQWSFTFTATNAAGQSTSATQTLTELAPPAPIPSAPPIPPPTTTGGVGSYDHSGDAAFCSIHVCIGRFTTEPGYIVECSDGTYSHAGGIQGACSYHGGEL